MKISKSVFVPILIVSFLIEFLLFHLPLLLHYATPSKDHFNLFLMFCENNEEKKYSQQKSDWQKKWIVRISTWILYTFAAPAASNKKSCKIEIWQCQFCTQDWCEVELKNLH